MLKPLSDRAVVKLIENEKITKGGIILTSGLKDTVRYAEVVEVGKGNEKIKIEVNKGEKVIIKENSGTEITYMGEDLIIINQSDILAICQ